MPKEAFSHKESIQTRLAEALPIIVFVIGILLFFSAVSLWVSLEPSIKTLLEAKLDHALEILFSIAVMVIAIGIKVVLASDKK